MSTDTIPDTFPSQVDVSSGKVVMSGGAHAQSNQSFAFDPQSEKLRPPATAVVGRSIRARLRELTPAQLIQLFSAVFRANNVAYEDYDWCGYLLSFYNNVVDACSPQGLTKQALFENAFHVDIWAAANKRYFTDFQEAILDVLTVKLVHQTIADLVNHYNNAFALDPALLWYAYQYNRTVSHHGVQFGGLTLRDYPEERETRTAQSVGSITLFNKGTGEMSNANTVQACPNYINHDFDRNPTVVMPSAGASELGTEANLIPSFTLGETARSSINSNLNNGVTPNDQYTIKPLGFVTLIARFLAFYWRYGFMPNKILYTRTEVRQRHMYWLIGEREKTASAGPHTLVITQGVTLASNSVNSWLLQAACMQQAIGGDLIIVAPNVKVSNYTAGSGHTHVEDVVQFANHMFTSMYNYSMHELYVLAMATEFHKWLTVNSHTAEGGVMRKLFTGLVFGGNAMILDHPANGTHNNWGLDLHADKYCIFNLMRLYTTITFGALIYADCGYLYKDSSRIGLTPVELTFVATKFDSVTYSQAFTTVLGLHINNYNNFEYMLMSYHSQACDIAYEVKVKIEEALRGFIYTMETIYKNYEYIDTPDSLTKLKREITLRSALSRLINNVELRLLYRRYFNQGSLQQNLDMCLYNNGSIPFVATNDVVGWPYLMYLMMMAHVVTALPVAHIFKLVRLSCMISRHLNDELKLVSIQIDDVEQFVTQNVDDSLVINTTTNNIILPQHLLYTNPADATDATKIHFDVTAFKQSGGSMRGDLIIHSNYSAPPEPTTQIASGVDAYEQIRAAVTFVSAQAYLRALRCFFPHSAEMRYDAVDTFRSMFASFNGRVYTDRHLLGDRHTVFPFCTLEPTSIFPPAVYNPTTMQTVRSFAANKNPGGMAFTGRCITPTGLVDINNELHNGSFYNYAGVMSPRCNPFAVYSRMSVKNGLFDVMISDKSNCYYFCPEENIRRTDGHTRNRFVALGDLTHAPDNTGTHMPFEGMFGSGVGVMGVSMQHPLRKNHYAVDLTKYAMLIQYFPYQDIVTTEKISVITYRNKNPITKKKFQDFFEYQNYYKNWLRVNDVTKYQAKYRERYNDSDGFDDADLRGTALRTFYSERRLRGTVAFTSNYLTSVNYSARNTAFLTEHINVSRNGDLFQRSVNPTTSGTLDTPEETQGPEDVQGNSTLNTANRDVGNNNTRPPTIGNKIVHANPYDNTDTNTDNNITSHQFSMSNTSELNQQQQNTPPTDVTTTTSTTHKFELTDINNK